MRSRLRRHPEFISGSRPTAYRLSRLAGMTILAGTTILAGMAFLAGCQLANKADYDVALGREIFTERANPTCGTCHTLKDVGTEATVGPNLDTLKPDSARVSVAVRYGVGIMPPQTSVLTDEEIAAVSKYVAEVASDEL